MKPTTRWVAAFASLLLIAPIGCGEDDTADTEQQNNDGEVRDLDNQRMNDAPGDSSNQQNDSSNQQNDSSNQQNDQSDPCADVDCSGDQHCQSTTGECVDCLDGTDCGDGEVCDTSNSCVPEPDPVGCTSDDDCSGGNVCDPDIDDCVPCLEDGDCSDGEVCDSATLQCVECLGDDDCPDGKCDTDTNVCEVDDGGGDDGGGDDGGGDCCSFSSEEVPTDGTEYLSQVGFDFGLTDGGEPVVAMLDYIDEDVDVAERTDGSWSTIDVVDLSDYGIYSDTQVSTAAGPGDDIHIVVASDDELLYMYRDNGEWSGEVIESLGWGASFTAASVAVGDDDAVHIVGGLSSGATDSFYYERRLTDGSRHTASHDLKYSDETVGFADIDMRSDNQPAMMMSMIDDETQILWPEDVTASEWAGGAIGAGPTVFTTLAVDADDTPWAMLSPSDDNTLESWEFTGTGDDDWDQWNAETLSSVNAGKQWFTIDDGNTGHASYIRDTGDEVELTYARRPDSSSWQNHTVDTAADTDWDTRIAVDATTPHVVAITADETLRYYSIDSSN